MPPLLTCVNKMNSRQRAGACLCNIDGGDERLWDQGKKGKSSQCLTDVYEIYNGEGDPNAILKPRIIMQREIHLVCGNAMTRVGNEIEGYYYQQNYVTGRFCQCQTDHKHSATTSKTKDTTGPLTPAVMKLAQTRSISTKDFTWKSFVSRKVLTSPSSWMLHWEKDKTEESRHCVCVCVYVCMYVMLQERKFASASQ